MSRSLMLRQRNLFVFVLVGLLSAVFLTACDGTAFIDINFDPTEGVGNIVITGDQDEPAPQTDDDTSMSQLLLFGLVIALLLGTVAIVMSLARRPR